jgi:molybdopterin-containing oxidoreductase family iron-sulfur binding subunit
MSGESARNYWKSLPERDGQPGEEVESANHPETTAGPDRRDFLRAAGFLFAGTALAGCQRTPTRYALPLVDPSEEIVPGRASYYASTCGACPAGCGALVKCRDGRPIKLEGNPDHPLSRGGLCAVGQASLLGLYDRLRPRQPLHGGREVDWAAVDRDIRQRLDDIRRTGGAVRVLSRSILSPTLRASIHAFVGQFRGGRHVVYDPLSCSAILDAHERTHGVRVLPQYHFDRAAVIASFDADFLGTWISPMEFTAGYRNGRVPPQLSWHTQFEARLSLTGGKADQRIRLAPGEIGLTLTHLANRLAGLAALLQPRLPSAGLEAPPVPAALLDQLAERLWLARPNALVVCGSQDVSAQVLVNFINHLLGAYGNTVNVERPSFQRQGNDGQLRELLRELGEGRVAALFLIDCNPAYDLPDGETVADALRRVPLLVSCVERLDETARLAHYVCPIPHYLESWGDAEPVNGVVSLSQPTVRLPGSARPVVESLAAWAGSPATAYAILRGHWQRHVFPRQDGQRDFQAFWDRSLHDGYARVRPTRVAVRPFDAAAVQPVARAQPTNGGTFTVVLYPKVGLLDGRHAYNPWLQELPDPISKVTWDNYACLSPAAAARLNVRDGDVVRLETSEGAASSQSLELPVLVQPGQHDQVVAVALGYGSQLSARFGEIGPRWLEGRPTLGPNGLVGVNAAPLLTWEENTLRPVRPHVRVAATGRSQPLACTQSHHTITVPRHLAPPGQERRPLIREFALPVLPPAHHQEPPADLWPEDHPMTGRRWAMVIDLAACTGCSACVMACQAENNVPVVGKDEVRRQREMHWIRIDRYYSGDGDDVVVAHQPMLCQHCENAPCETVCPVLATVHSAEGLNQQVYNRCVGTRYCANNCPYKARRFNWFNYPREDALHNLVLNPDVTVRSRGVMEKCSFCVQRIRESRGTAVQTACQQSCPAQAIVFGDANDPNSRVARLMSDPRRYQVLGEFNVRPSVSYLGLVRNRPTAAGGERHE